MVSRIFRRRLFLQSVFAVSALPGASPQADRGFVVGPGATRPGKGIPIRGTIISVRVSGDDNGGGFALFEIPASPMSGPPLHVHHIEDECFHVLEGQLKVQVGPRIFMLDQGASVYLPRMVPHTWQTVGQRPARFLSLAQPAGRLEAYVIALSALVRQGAPDAASMKALFEEYEMEMIGPPLPDDGHI
jgi:mannose-6-phosphate isomerase-like protein (cupin superfamily)